MAELDFTVLDVVPEPYAAAPNLLARIRIEERSGETVHALALRCQVRIEPQRRRYSEAEERGLLDLFGGRERFAQTLRPFLWLHASTVVQGFTGSVDVDLVLPCTYDIEVSGAKYLGGVRDGEVPLLFLYNGTVFTRGASGFTVSQIPWDRESSYRLPVQVWRDLMDAHFPNAGWVRMRRDTMEALAEYKAARGLTSWDETVETLLAGAGDQVAR
ncbi:MAG: hypothetical protein H0U77_08025 [Nocardioidaceae bacterium]|nr:hypothetical protein [Nocardioidaceae bacterium]